MIFYFFQRPFEILEKEAEFRGTDNDLSRALAFRRAACVLKSLPYQLCRLSQVRDRRHIGDHVLKVLKVSRGHLMLKYINQSSINHISQLIFPQLYIHFTTEFLNNPPLRAIH